MPALPIVGQSLKPVLRPELRLAFDDAPFRATGIHIAGNLNCAGYLACAVEEIAAACGTAPAQ